MGKNNKPYAPGNVVANCFKGILGLAKSAIHSSDCPLSGFRLRMGRKVVVLLNRKVRIKNNEMISIL